MDLRIGRTAGLFILAGLGLGLGIACGNDPAGDGGAGSCVPNQQNACVCPDGTMSIQICNAAGVFDPCQCGLTGTATTGETDPATTDDTDSNSGDTGPDLCGNGFEDPGECDPEGTNFCEQDCPDESSSSGGADTSTGESCANDPIYVGLIPNEPSLWENAGVMGYAAGVAKCNAMAADDVCTYEQVVQAEANGELAVIAAGTTAWINRLSITNYMGVNINPDPRTRCADWNYDTNHINDGEYAIFGAGGAVTYMLDSDPASFAMDEFNCGGQTRAILCCNDCDEL